MLTGVELGNRLIVWSVGLDGGNVLEGLKSGAYLVRSCLISRIWQGEGRVVVMLGSNRIWK